MASELEKAFTEEEFHSAVKSMQNGKCPGPDGFPSEFFKKFARELDPRRSLHIKNHLHLAHSLLLCVRL